MGSGTIEGAKATMKAPLAFLCLSSLLPTVAWAGRPLFTDDAGLTEARSCQMEAWWQGSENTHEWWALPACNPFGNFEVTAGFTALKADGSDRVRSYLVQGKTLVRPLASGSYGFGVAFGITRPHQGQGGTDYAYVPLSLMSGTGATAAHFNLGWLRDRAADSSRTSWGLGVEHAWTGRLSTFGEVFGDSASDPTLHAGFSFGLIPERIQLDTTYGHNAGVSGNGNFYSVGVNIYLPAF